MLKRIIVALCVNFTLALAVYGMDEKFALVPLECTNNLNAIGSLKVGLIKRLPLKARKHLAVFSSRFKKEYIQSLIEEVQSLIPAEALRFMAYMPQTSQSYLLNELPPDPKIKRTKPENEYDSAFYDAQSSVWQSRILSAIQRLRDLIEYLSIQALTPEETQTKFIAHLYLGLLTGFSYSFQYEIEKGIPAWQTLNMVTPYLDEATHHLEMALKMYSAFSSQNRDAKIYLKFLLGKHLNNSALLHLHDTGLVRKPDEKYFPHVKMARELLTEVVHDSQQRVEDGKFLPIYFEARYHLLQSLRMRDENNFHDRDFITWDFITGVSTDILNEMIQKAPRAWLEQNITSQYSLAHRLLTDLRWGIQDEKDSPRWNARFELQSRTGGAGNPLTLEEFFELAETAGLLVNREKIEKRHN